MKQTDSLFRLVITGILAFSLSACVTTVESRLTKKASPEKAVENYTQLGLGYLKENRPDLARQRLQKALSINDRYPPANDAMGLMWQTEGEPDLAEDFYRKAIAEDSKLTSAKHHLGRLYSQTQQYDKAESWLRKATEDRYYDGRTQAFNDLAMNYYRQGNKEKAIDAYSESLRLGPYAPDPLVNISTLLFENQQYKESQKYWDRLDRLVQREQTRHTAHSLWLGIRLSNIFQSSQRAARLAVQLRQDFPSSEEFRQYQDSLGDGQTFPAAH
jgi:type IV pilus assembly protein PilF